MQNIDSLINNLDLKLFENISSLSSPNDKTSFLACQKAVRELLPEYIYLEIGSYMGGSLQPYVMDERCRRIFSIDKRPPTSPDESGFDAKYAGNTTAAMIEGLKKNSPEGIKKITAIDGDVSDIDPAKVDERPQVCLVDGEHTDEAAIRDYEFCRKVMTENGAVLFHDSAIIYKALLKIIKDLETEGVKFKAYNIPDYVFVIEFGDFPMHKTESINNMLINNHVGYLNSLYFTEPYRKFTMKPIFRFVRAIKHKFVPPKYV